MYAVALGFVFAVEAGWCLGRLVSKTDSRFICIFVIMIIIIIITIIIIIIIIIIIRNRIRNIIKNIIIVPSLITSCGMEKR